MSNYNNKKKIAAIRTVIKMESDYGGTDFLTPLNLAKHAKKDPYK